MAKEKPTCIIDENGVVTPLSSLSEKDQTEYLISIGWLKVWKKRPKGKPGENKNQRKQKRGGQRFY